ncbi:hypothetical protein A3762_05130 [Oleiphilus sp. HI0125]|uniref:HDOD domain-containing protein n=1 Tax=Oleiphilus sp. HI0125 TaxID=1822266 RepID=UPI0007C2DB81|nr:HDOD domain-containing protein [Oleiphilus sp. HI0125]KZZ59476.1 hypothetical protein A3762_05130 [Oleiphilus sp. HI0125]
MAETTTYPQDLQSWVEYLLKRKLPSALSLAPKAVLLMENEAPSYLKLAQILAPDPVVSLAIMRKANDNPRPESVFSKTLDHAMSMLGHQQVKELLVAIKKLDIKYGYRAYYQTLGASLIKAYLALQFAKAKGSAKSLDIFWGSLFSDAPMWYMWCYATPLMREISRASIPKRKALELDLLGCSLKDIQLELLTALNAPDLALKTQHCLSLRDWAQLSRFGQASAPTSASQSVAQANPAEPIELSPALKIARQQPLFFIELSRFYLHYYLKDSSPKQMSRALATTAAGLDIPVDKVRTLCTKTLLKAAHRYQMPYSANAVCRVFDDVKEYVPDAQGETSATGDARTEFSRVIPSTGKVAKSERIIESTGAKKQEDQKTITPETSFLHLLKAIKQQPTDFNSASALMTKMVEQIQIGLHLKRCALCVLSKDISKLNIVFKSGIDGDDPLASFSTPIIKGTIFSVLCDKPAALWLKPSVKKEVADLVPMNFKQTTQRDEAFFASIFVKGKPIGVVYADQDPDQRIDEAQFRYFKLAIKALESSLGTISQDAQDS